MTKTTTKQTGLQTQAEYEATLSSIADLIILRDLAQNCLDEAILKAREQHGESVTSYNDMIASKMALAEAYAMRHRDALLPDGTKSAETTKARWGWRLGNPTLKLLSSRHKWATVCKRLIETGRQAFLKAAEPKPDKDRLKAELTDEQLAEVGLRIEQVESFWVEPKTDSQQRETN